MLFPRFGDDEEVLAAGMCPAPLSEVAGPHKQVQRHTVEQIVDFVPVPQMGASILAVLEQAIVPSGRGAGRSSPCSVGGCVGVGYLAGRTS